MNNLEAAGRFTAIGSESRLTLLRLLVKAGDKGLSVGEIQKRLSIPASTLAHHIKFLSTTDLIIQEKQGRVIMNRANYPILRKLADFILHECCSEDQVCAEQSCEDQPCYETQN